ncbi:MAG: YdcF family protein [bacterium]|nr:YdcF family protein [bacterium]
MSPKNQNISQATMRLAKILWDYHHVHHALRPADLIICFTSLDLSVPEYVAELFQKKFASRVLFAGNEAKSGDIQDENNIQRVDWGMSEADKFAEVAIQRGVPGDAILIENQSNNSGDNVLMSHALLKGKELIPRIIILVQKPTMERRAYATFKKLWPEKDYELMVTSPPHTFERYIKEVVDADTIINIMVGDVQRIQLYPAKGFQIPQNVPAEVKEAFFQLVQLGYTKHLIQKP